MQTGDYLGVFCYSPNEKMRTELWQWKYRGRGGVEICFMSKISGIGDNKCRELSGEFRVTVRFLTWVTV